MSDDKSALCLAEILLSKVLNCTVKLTLKHDYSNHKTVQRYAATHGLSDANSSYIVKRYDTSIVDENQAFCNELICLTHLDDIVLDCVPRLIVHDRIEGILIIQDFEQHQVVHDLFLGVDRSLADCTLDDMALTLASIHCSSFGREAEFSQRFRKLNTTLPEADVSLDIRVFMSIILHAFQLVDIQVTSKLWEIIDVTEHHVHDDPTLKVLVHGDAAPHNFLHADCSTVLIDYEYANYKSFALDVASARMAFPTILDGMALPIESINRFEKIYRENATVRLPQLDDDKIFGQAIVCGCTHWTLVKIYGMCRRYIERVRSNNSDIREIRFLEEDFKTKQRILEHLRLLIETLSIFPVFPNWREQFDSIYNQLVSAWQIEHKPSIYPAFL